MNNYEVMYIVKPVVEEEAFEAVVAKFESLITANGGTVEKNRPLGQKNASLMKSRIHRRSVCTRNFQRRTQSC